MKKPNILYFDIETSHCIAAVWGGGKQYVGHEQILKDRKILTICYVWNEDKNPTTLTLDLSKHDLTKFDDTADKEMLLKFSRIYEQADLAVAHNGRQFDVARLRARLVKHGLPDIKPTLFDDSYSLCKNIDFTFHKLDHLGKSFGLGKKIETRLRLWIDIVWRKSKKALQEMARYNIQDVLLLRKVYKKLKPYSKSALNMAIYNERPNSCPSCGSHSLALIRHRYTNTGKKSQFRCRKCFSYCTKGYNQVSNTKQYNRN